MKPLQQVYSDYTSDDFAVWKTLFTRQVAHLQGHAAQEYLDGITKVGFVPEKIPDFREVNRILTAETGWSLTVVPNLCPERDFFDFISRRMFTATCWIRTVAQLDYIEEPDMFHDVFGHVPLLSYPEYASFMHGLGKIATDFIDNPVLIEQLGRLYWFTIEFGLMYQSGGLRAYGAGIMSSYGETSHALGAHTQKLDFDIRKILNTPYRNDIMQDKYFVIESFDQLYNSLTDIEIYFDECCDSAGLRTVSI